MNSQNEHINNEVVRQEQEKQRLGLSGGMQLKSYKDDSAKKVMAITRKGVAQFEAEDKLVDIKDSVNRFKVDRYFNDLSTSIANVINNYLQGVKQNDTGDIISKYNELSMYLKTVINWKTLSENDRNMITAKFNELLPQVNELMDVAITEKYTDVKQIEELKNNLVVRNYVPVMYVNYAEAIKTKKPDYATRKMLSTKLFRILNDPATDEKVKQDLEDKVEIYDEARNKFVSAKNKDRKLFYKNILEQQEKVLNVIIDGVFKSIKEIPRDREIEKAYRLDLKGEPADYEEEYKYEEPYVSREFNPDEYFAKEEEYNRAINKPRKLPARRTRDEMMEYLGEKPGFNEFYTKKFMQDLDIDAVDVNERDSKNYFKTEKSRYRTMISNLKIDLEKLNKEYEDNKQELDVFLKSGKKISEGQINNPRTGPLKKGLHRGKLQRGNVELPALITQNETDMESKNKLLREYEKTFKKLEKDEQADMKYYEDERRKIEFLGKPEDVKKVESDILRMRESREQNLMGEEDERIVENLTKEKKSKGQRVLSEFSRQNKKAREQQRLKELEKMKSRQTLEEMLVSRREKERMKRVEDEQRQIEAQRKEEQNQELLKALQEENNLMFGYGKRKLKKGRGVPRVLRNAIRKPLSIKNPSENDPNVELYPQYDLSKYDAQIIKRR